MPKAKIPPQIISAAQEAQQKWKVPASISLAQWALESAWGRQMPQDSNNPFGIKAVKGQPKVIAKTHEFLHGRYVTVEAPFRQFASIADAFVAHARLLATKPAYQRAMKSPSPERFAKALTGIYATDPQYGEKLIKLMEGYDLYQFDSKGTAN